MVQGSCLCGAVAFEVAGEAPPIGMCHCSKCRKVSGVASNATFMVARDRLAWTRGEDRIKRFALPTGWGVSRCAVCGSPLPSLHPSGGAYWVPAGLLDADPGSRVAAHIYVGSKAAWDEIGGHAPRYEESYGSESADD